MNEQNPRRPRVRLTPEAREEEIVRHAVRFFARNGFGGQTRELAYDLGISQSLIFRYFPTKEDLIERVYEDVFGKAWKPDLVQLGDRSRPLEERLTTFYRDYADLILEHDYTRLLLFSALGDVNFHRRLFPRIAGEIYPLVIEELRAHYGRPPIAENTPTEAEIEAVWGLHAAIFFLGIREHIFGLPVPPPDEAISAKIRSFLNGVAEVI